MGAQVIRHGALDMQVCVPKKWDDAMVKSFANRENPSGTEGGWHIRKQGDPALAGADERVQCVDADDCCHMVLDA